MLWLTDWSEKHLEDGEFSHQQTDIPMKLIPSTLLIALLSLVNIASAADKAAPQSGITTAQNGSADQIHAAKSTLLQVSGGLTMYPIGDTFFALLPTIPLKLETPEEFLKNHITSVVWQVSDSRSLGEEHQFGLSLKSPADSASDTPTLVHFSGLPKAFKLNDIAKLQLNEKGNLVVSIGKETYPVLLKKDMKTASISTSASGLATTTVKPADK